MADDNPRTIVIIGGGIIGACTAFHICTHPKYTRGKDTVILLEATAIAGGASGKGAGLLATWADPACLAPLSFRTHVELADKYDGASWGFRRVECAEARVQLGEDDVSTSMTTGAATGASDASPGGEWPREIDWLPRNIMREYLRDGDGVQNTAQVHPELFTKKMIALAEEHGLQVILGKVTRINTKTSTSSSSDPETTIVESVTYTSSSTSPPTQTPTQTQTLPATDIIVAAGPWTTTLLPTTRITGVHSHSVVMAPAPAHPLTAHILSPMVLRGVSAADAARFHNFQIYPRPDGTAFICGHDDDAGLPDSTAQVEVVQAHIDELREASARLCPAVFAEAGAGGGNPKSSAGGGARLLKAQACYRPRVEGRLNSHPLLGFTRTRGLLVAAGHDEWGIQNSAGSGKVVSEMVWDGRAISADVAVLDPRVVMDG